MGSGKAKTIDIRYRRKRGGVDWDEKCPHLVRVRNGRGSVLHTLGSSRRWMANSKGMIGRDLT